MSASPRPISWGRLLLLIAVAALVRLAFYNGPFGSDDGTYYPRALEISRGMWTSADYNGALRFGFNVPAGLLMRVFGDSMEAANLWPFLCSLSEVLAVAWIATSAFGPRVGLVAAALLAAAPLHIAVATRIHADPVVSAALTWGVVLTYHGLVRQSRGLLFAAGLALGGVYWAKELAAVCYFGLLPLLWCFRHRPRDILVVVGAILLMLALNGLLFLWVAGDPLHGVKVVLSQLRNSFVQGPARDEPWYYLPYLFIDVRHVGLLGWLALCGVLAGRSTPGSPSELSGRAFVIAWLLGTVVVLSLFPVSFHPLRFTMKQSNYLTLILAPLAVCAAVGLQLLANRPALQRGLLGLGLALGILLAALQQADYRGFTAVSKGLFEEAQRSGATYVGSVNNSRLATELSRVGGASVHVLSWAEAKADAARLQSLAGGDGQVIVVLDPQTRDWPSGGSGPRAPLPCWVPDGAVLPVDLGLGNNLVDGMARFAKLAHAPRTVLDRLHALAEPTPGQKFKAPAADLLCEG